MTVVTLTVTRYVEVLSKIGVKGGLRVVVGQMVDE